MKSIILIRYILLIVVLNLISIQGNSKAIESSLIDSLANNSSDYTRVKLLHKLSENHWEKDFEKAIKFSSEALNIAKWNGYTREIIDSYNLIGSSYFVSKNYSKSLENFFLAAKYSKKLAHEMSLAKSYRNIGFVYKHLKLPEEAIKYSLLAIESLGSKEDIELLTDCYFFLSISYQLQKDHLKEIYYILKSIELRERNSQLNELGEEYNRLGIAYFNSRDYSKALNYFERYLDFSNQNNDSVLVSRAYINIASTLNELGKPKQSIEKLFCAIALNQSNVCDSYLGLVKSYSRLGNSAKAAYYFVLAFKSKADLVELLDACKTLSTLFKETKNYDKAFYYNNLYYSLNDSLRAASTKEITFADPKYDVVGIEARIAEKENAELLKENYLLQSKQNRLLIIILSLTFILAVCLLYIFGKKLIEARRNLLREKERLRDISSTLLEMKECVSSIKRT